MTQSSSEHESTHSPVILIVDDEVSVLQLLKAILQKENFEVHTADNCASALKLLDERFFDLVITDALMPGMDGYAFVANIRKHPLYAEIPILMLTRKRQREDVKKAVEVGVTDYIIKPIDEALLAEKVQQCLRKSATARKEADCALSEKPAPAEIIFKCHVTSITESTLTVQLPFPIGSNDKFLLNTTLFETIGIERPMLGFLRCNPSQADKSAYDVEFSLIDMEDEDRRKLRSWCKKHISG